MIGKQAVQKYKHHRRIPRPALGTLQPIPSLIFISKQPTCAQTKQINGNILFHAEPFFFLCVSFLLPWVRQGHKFCHVVYMLTQKEGQVLAMRSLGLMWPGHGYGSSESPVEPQWHVVSIHLQSETFYANWQSVALAYPPPRGNSPDWCLLDMH